jgi:enoyl-CoA hydratase/carnithine racemase
MITLLDDLDKVTIAAVNGHAVGVGMDLAICCDFVLASEAATFAASYVLRGLVPDGGGMYYLPRRVGLAHAKELIYSGRSVDAPEALTLGLADRLAAPSELESAALSWARELAKSSPTAVALAKRVLNRSFDLTRDEVLARSAEAQAICYTTDEHRNAVAEFLEARKARHAADD